METIQHGSPAYAQAANMILNADHLWKRALIDTKDSVWVGNDLKKGRIVNNTGTLRHEDHLRIMEQLIAIRRRSLNGIADLQSAGLTSSESISTQLVGTENINEFQAAKRDMNPTAFQDNQTDFSLVYTPLPITHQSWRIPFRQMGFPYKRSIGLSESVRQVSESLEDMLFNGDSNIQVTVNSVASTIQGYTTATNRSTATITDWTNLATNRTNIIPDVLKLTNALFTEGAVSAPNSAILYVANNFWNNLQDDYSLTHGSSTTIVERIKQISQIRDVKPAEKLAAGTVMLVEMSDAAVELSMASDIVTVPHIRTNELDDQVFTTYAVMVPVLKTDRNNRMGIVHGTQ